MWENVGCVRFIWLDNCGKIWQEDSKDREQTLFFFFIFNHMWFFFPLNFIYLFIFGCFGSSCLCEGFL